MTSDHEKSPLIYLQILKLEKIMSLYFLDRTSFEGDMRYDIFKIGDLIINIRTYILK